MQPRTRLVFFVLFNNNQNKRSWNFWKFCKVLVEIGQKKSISLIVRALWIVGEVESYAPSKFQPPTTLGDHQNVEKTIRKKINFFGFRKSVFHPFFWISEGIDNFRRQNQFPREILLQIRLFWGPCDQKLRKNDLCCDNLAAASPTRARPSRGLCWLFPTIIKW